MRDESCLESVGISNLPGVIERLRRSSVAYTKLAGMVADERDGKTQDRSISVISENGTLPRRRYGGWLC